MSAASLHKPTLKMAGSSTSIGGVQVVVLMHPGKGKIPLKIWKSAVKAVADSKPAPVKSR